MQIERVAFAGDWHMNYQWARRAIRHAADQGAQGIAHLGDFGYTFIPEFLKQVTGALDSTGLHLWFVDGNHEKFPKLEQWTLAADGSRPLTSRITHLPRGYRWQWSGVRFLAMGGAHSVDRMSLVPGRSWWPQETITKRQAHRAMRGGRADVLVSHDCPAGVVIPGIDDRRYPAPFPVDELRRNDEHRKRLATLTAVVQPSAVWHGHYHLRHRTVADLGYGPVVVNGLDCDESTLADNIHTVNVADMIPEVVTVNE
jgi:predicted phosphodiesterase